MSASATTFAPRSVGAFRFTGWSADWDEGVIDARYALDDAHHFTESYRFPVFAERHLSDARRRGALDRAARLLHLVAGASYFKAAVPPRIEIEGPAPSPRTARFLGRLYTQGLGEFAWRNRLPEIGARHRVPFVRRRGGRAAARPRGPRARARWCRWAAARTRS